MYHVPIRRRHEGGTGWTALMSEATVGVAALRMEMWVAAIAASGGRAVPGLGMVVMVETAIGAVVVLLGLERMRAWACFTSKRSLLHQILVVGLHQMPQRLTRR